MDVKCRVVGWVSLENLGKLLQAVYEVEFPEMTGHLGRVGTSFGRGMVFLPKFNEAAVLVAQDHWVRIADRDTPEFVLGRVLTGRCRLLAFPQLLIQQYPVKFVVCVNGTLYFATPASDRKQIEVTFSYTTLPHTERAFIRVLAAMLPFLRISDSLGASAAAADYIREHRSTSSD